MWEAFIITYKKVSNEKNTFHNLYPIKKIRCGCRTSKDVSGWLVIRKKGLSRGNQIITSLTIAGNDLGVIAIRVILEGAGGDLYVIIKGSGDARWADDADWAIEVAMVGGVGDVSARPNDVQNSNIIAYCQWEREREDL